MIEKQPRGRSERGLGGGSELDHALVVEMLPADRARLRKFREYELEQTGIEEIIENDMRKRPGVDVRRVCGRTQLLHARQRQERVERHILDRQPWIPRKSTAICKIGSGPDGNAVPRVGSPRGYVSSRVIALRGVG